jgi:PAS domain-containing protein
MRLKQPPDFDMGWRGQAELYRCDDKEVITSGQPKIDFEEPQTTPAGDTIWLKTSKIPLRAADGSVYGVLGTYEDLTEEKDRACPQGLAAGMDGYVTKPVDLEELTKAISEVST